MESALTISPPTARASRSARADLPLAVGPAISQMRCFTARGAMQIVLTLVAPDFDVLQEALPLALEAVAGAGSPVKDTEILGDGAADIFLDHDDPTISRARAEDALERMAGRYLRPAGGASQEAPAGRRHGFHHHRLRVPGRAGRLRRHPARGRGDHRAGHARRDRVRGARCASGWPCWPACRSIELQRCFDERVRLNPGARTLVATMAANGARCVLVSGGFDFFTAPGGPGGRLPGPLVQPADRRRRGADRPGGRADPRARGQARGAEGRGGRRRASPWPTRWRSATAPTTWT